MRRHREAGPAENVDARDPLGWAVALWFERHTPGDHEDEIPGDRWSFL
jgi:hypothetical protein